jgi:hypothetical protein
MDRKEARRQSALLFEADDEQMPRTPPTQQTAPQHPHAQHHALPHHPPPSSSSSSIQATTTRFDRAFLNPDRTLHFAHRAAADDESVEPRMRLHSTKRIEKEIEKIHQMTYPEMNTISLDSVEKRAVIRRVPIQPKKDRYERDTLVDVNPKVPLMKPRKVKIQIDEKWKHAMEGLPSADLPEGVDFYREECISAIQPHELPVCYDDAFHRDMATEKYPIMEPHAPIETFIGPPMVLHMLRN